MRKNVVDRSLLIDGLKALAAQAIVLHHLVSYGPMATAAGRAAPDLVAWLLTYGHWAVQVFLVIAGFLTARTFCEQEGALSRPWSVLAKRYVRLVWPFGVAITLAVFAAALARLWTNDDILPAAPSWIQFLSHWLLIQGVMGQESLSTGVWYVAIDFQLFALTILLLWASQALRWRGWAPLLIGMLTVGSLVWIRTWQNWDNWAPYFYNAYGVGLLVGWLGLDESVQLRWVHGALLAVVGVLGWQLLTMPNGRLVVILLTGLLLWLSAHPVGRAAGALPLWEGRLGQGIHYLGSRSYALFLLHFPVSMLVNAAQDHFDWTTPAAGLWAVLCAWLSSMLLADFFYRTVEQQGVTLSRRLR